MHKTDSVKNTPTKAKHGGSSKRPTAKASVRRSLTPREITEKEDIPLFTVDIVSLKHVASERYPIEVNVSVYFKNVLLGTTYPIIIRNQGQYDFNFKITYPVKEISRDIVDQVLSEPLFFVLTKTKNPSRDQSYPAYAAPNARGRNKKKLRQMRIADSMRRLSMDSDEDDEEEGKKIRVVKRKFRQTAEPAPPCSWGEATLDLLPFLQGNKAIEEELKLERPENQYSTHRNRLRPLNSRTMLHIKVTDTSNFTETIPSLHNYLVYGVESLYHVDTTDLSEASQIVAAIPMPLNAPSGSEDRIYKLYYFEPGMLSTRLNLEFKHKWHGLANQIFGKAVYSKIRVPYTFDDIVQPTMEINLKNVAESKEPRINWNIMRRISLSTLNEEIFIKNILMYRCLPVEILMGPQGMLDLKPAEERRRSSGTTTYLKKQWTNESVVGSRKRRDSLGSHRKSTSNSESGDINLDHYVAFVDISGLLFAGATKVRAAAQVRRYSPEEYKEKWMLKQPLFNEVLKRTRNDKFDLVGGTPLTSSKGKPTFVLVEIRLMKPFVPPKEELIWQPRFEHPKRQKESLLGPTFASPNNFTSSIICIAETLKNELEDFNKLKEEKYEKLLVYENVDLYTHIQHSGSLQKIKETLRKHSIDHIVNILNGIPKDMSKSEKNDYVYNLYFKLLDHMTNVVNSFERDNWETGKSNLISYDTPTTDELLLFAVEAAEQLHYNKARYYLAKRMENNGYRNPDFWFDYAVMALRFGDFDSAMESIKEVIAIDIRHKLGLLTYAVLLTILGNFEAAELFFFTTIQFYPTFYQGWMALYLFYDLIQSRNGIVEAFILESSYHEEHEGHIPLLSWFKDVAETNDPFVKAAIFYLQYNLYEFAELSLAQYLARSGKCDIFYHYYIAVAHYIQGRFNDSVNHLLKALEFDEENPKIWHLLGLNYHLLGEYIKAQKSFNHTVTYAFNLEDYPLALIRIGYDFLDSGSPKSAKEVFQKVLKFYYSPLAWIGLAVAYYMQRDRASAEMAFTEANALDNNLPIVWCYLALINIHRREYDLYAQCLAEAKRTGLQDDKIFEKFENLQKKESSGTLSEATIASQSLSDNSEIPLSMKNKLSVTSSFVNVNCIEKCK